VKRHYERVWKETSLDRPANVEALCAPVVVVPIDKWNAVTERALRFAWSLSPDIQALHVECGEESENLRQCWASVVEAPAKQAGLALPELVIVNSPYRFVVAPIVDYVLELEKRFPDRQFAVLIPELVESRWYFYLLHNNRPQVLKAMLLFRGNKRVTVINIPWYLEEN
jgi:hypothetical protein